MTPLPSGRRGQALAIGSTLVVVAVLWLGVAAPALGWFADRADYLDRERALAARMAAVAATAPALQQDLAQAGTAAPAARSVLESATDAIASATLQQAVQDMATKAGATVTSAEALPAEPVGSYRRIGLHVAVSGGWPVIVALLDAMAQAAPRMLVDDLALHPSFALGPAAANPLEASFTVIAFNAGAANAP